VDITRLGDPPRFGFAVIGALTQRYGFSVSVDTLSPYGGVRAVVFLPSALLTHLDAAVQAPVPSAAPAAPTSAAAPALSPAQAPSPGTAPTADPAVPESGPGTEPAAATTPGGLPRRRRRTARQPAAEPAPADEVGGRSAEENARRMGAFARGTRTGRAAQHTRDEHEGNSHE
jgi:hypothetical protein